MEAVGEEREVELLQRRFCVKRRRIDQEHGGSKGHGLIALHPFQQGDTIMATPSLGLVLLGENSRRLCHFCLFSHLQLLRCSRCHTSYYCDQQCQMKDWQCEHKHLCKVLQQQKKKAGDGRDIRQHPQELMLAKMLTRMLLLNEKKPNPTKINNGSDEVDMTDQVSRLLRLLVSNRDYYSSDSIESFQLAVDHVFSLFKDGSVLCTLHGMVTNSRPPQPR